MLLKIKKIIKDFIPPVLLRILKPNKTYGWFGNYLTWADAKNHSTGYDSDKILQKCKEAALKVKRGEALFERDSVLFYKNDYSYSWITLSGLLHCASSNNGRLNVIDFGGALGSSYYQFLHFFSSINSLELKWSIIEQENFTECGKKYFQNKILSYYSSIEDCLLQEKPNVLLLSSVLQYLEHPFEWLNKLLSLNIEYLIIDRTPFVLNSSDIISVQNVPRDIYDASYPCWSFNENKFLEKIINKYDLILEHDATDKSNFRGMYFRGFVFKLKK